MSTNLQGRRRWCVVYAGPQGSGVAGPITKGGAKYHAEQLLEAGAASAVVMEFEPWANVRDRYGIERSEAAIRNEAYRRGRQLNLPPVLVDATAFTRRYQALMTLGYSLPVQEKLGGFPTWGLRCIAQRQQEKVTVRNDELMRRLYDRLWDKPAVATTKGERVGISRTLTHARRNGFAPPLAWDDETIGDPQAQPRANAQGKSVDPVLIERVLAGRADPSKMNRQERKAAVAVLAKQGVSKTQTAKRLNMSGAAVANHYQEVA